MPEIAEVERARTILEQILKDQTLIDVEAVCSILYVLSSSSMTRSSSRTPQQKTLPPPSKAKK